MNLIEELRTTLRMEVRANSSGNEYLEAVIARDDLVLLQRILTKHFGSPAKEPGRQAALPMEIQSLVDSTGGLRVEQAFFYKRTEGQQVLYAALWPWESNPEKITLKTGVAFL
jgi:hypothetical protein